MKNNVNDFSYPCSGCGACVFMCAKKAIKLKLDEEGFFTANVDESLCVNCGLCKNVCMRAGAKDGAALKNGKVIAAQSSDISTVKKCTSGGIAYELSKYAFEKGMGVLGVIYNYKTNRAESKVAETAEDIELFRGSKYIQSYTEKAFGEMLDDMKKNPERKYIAFGTPCQIYGLASLLENFNMRNRAILVDLFCHGVPSYSVWDKYLQSLSQTLGTESLTEVNFRDKSVGWHNFVIKLKSDKGEHKEASEGDLFYHAFFDNVLFSKACFDCPVRKDVSKADIRLGDYWGKRYQNYEDGISAVLLCTENGKNFFDGIKGQTVYFESGDALEVMTAQSVHSYPTEKYREKAFNDLKQGKNLKDTVKSYRKLFPAKKRIKLFVKEGTSKLPDFMRAELRRIYKKL